MTVKQTSWILVGTFAAASSAWSITYAQPGAAFNQRNPVPYSRSIPSDVHVLRHRFSVPLEQLVEPVRLADLRNSFDSKPAVKSVAPATSSPAASAPVSMPAIASATNQEPAARGEEPLDDPFADDPQPKSEGKIPSGKLLGIVGRALFESAPVPSLEGLRNNIPGLPPGPSVAPTDADANAGSDAEVAPAVDDLFAEPADSAPPTESEPAAEGEEDPFGGF